MGNVHMEASQINYRGGETKMSVEEAIKNAGSSYELPIASAETLGGVKIGSGISIAEGGAISADAQIPANPETDGVKVLTATTEEGITTLSWDEPESGGVDYSTTEQNTGLKWIDGRDIYQATVNFGALPNATTKSVNHGIENIDFIIERSGVAYNNDKTTMFVLPHFATATASSIETSVNATVVAVTTGVDRSGIANCYVTFRYVKTAV